MITITVFCYSESSQQYHLILVKSLLRYDITLPWWQNFWISSTFLDKIEICMVKQ